MEPSKLLAVDDDAPSAELIVRVAERCGYEAFATSDSRGVLNLVEALQPDVIAVDVSMPHIDALGLFRLLAARGFSGRLIVVSGQDREVLNFVRDSAAEMGLQRPEVHQKPLNFQALRETLGRLQRLPRAS